LIIVLTFIDDLLILKDKIELGDRLNLIEIFLQSDLIFVEVLKTDLLVFRKKIELNDILTLNEIYMIKTKNHNNNQTDTYQTNSQLINIQLNQVLTTNKNYIYNTK